MNTTSNAERRVSLVNRFGDMERRHRFASIFIKRGLAEQIHEMRVARGWTQSDLAQRSGKVQETISQLENPNYGNYTIKTLQRLAEAFDVALFVRFGPFSELVDRVVDLSPADLAVAAFDHDVHLTPPHRATVAQCTDDHRSSNRFAPAGATGDAELHRPASLRIAGRVEFRGDVLEDFRARIADRRSMEVS